MYMHTIANPTRSIDFERDEERTRACSLPAPTFSNRSDPAAGGRMTREPAIIWKKQ
jgi:hypothetical protein